MIEKAYVWTVTKLHQSWHGFTYKRGKYWYLNWYENGKRKQQTTKTTRKELAEDLRKKKEKELLLGQTISQDLPINELLKKFDESVQAKTSQELLDVIAKL